jgi:predicted tellurium resistance membrane protein TerC
MLLTRIVQCIPRSVSIMCHVLRCTTMTRYSGLQNHINVVLVCNSVFLLVLLSYFSFLKRLLRNADTISVKCLGFIFEVADT